MNDWVKIKDAALEAIKNGALNVVEETKATFLKNFIEAGIPFIETYAEVFVNEVKAQAANEKGWVKIRDLVIIPSAVQILLFIVKQIVQMVARETKAVAGVNTATA